MAELIKIHRCISAKAQYKWNRHMERHVKWLQRIGVFKKVDK